MCLHLSKNYCVLLNYYKCILSPLTFMVGLIIKFMMGPTLHVRRGSMHL